MSKMNRKDFQDIIRYLKSIYTLRTFLQDSAAVDTWYKTFENIDKDRFQSAVDRYIKTKDVPPTPANILELMDHNEQKEPTYKKMIWWGLYDPDGEEINDVYAPEYMSNIDVKEWFARNEDVSAYTVRRKYERVTVR